MATGEPDSLLDCLRTSGLGLLLPLFLLPVLFFKGKAVYAQYIADRDKDSDDELDEAGKIKKIVYDPYEGAEVVLKNLTKLEFNGLRGKLIRFQNDRERWLVDVVIHTTSMEEEHKELSLKLENLVVQKPQKIGSRAVNGTGPYTNKVQDAALYGQLDTRNGRNLAKEQQMAGPALEVSSSRFNLGGVFKAKGAAPKAKALADANAGRSYRTKKT